MHITSLKKISKTMPSKYSLLYKNDIEKSNDSSLPSLPEATPRESFRRISGIFALVTAFLAIYTFAVCRIRDVVARANHVPIPLDYCKSETRPQLAADY